jgi:hypothetical protein
MPVEVVKKNPMIGKNVKFALGNRESLLKSNKILKQVEMYIDGESGTIYVVPTDDTELVSNFQFKIEG